MGWGSILGTVAGTALGGPVGGAIGSGLGTMLEGDMAQNQANEFSQSSAQANRNFQEQMSNTAYQRAMKDMEAAGLNPMLAYSQGGASVPTGSMATYTPVAPATASASAAVQSASNDSARTPATVANVEADTALTKQQTKTEFFKTAVANNDAIKSNYAVMDLAATLDAAMVITKASSGVEALSKLKQPQVKAGLAELRAALASANNDAQVYEALNSKGVQIALDILGRLSGSGAAIAGAVDRYRARSQRGDIINLNKD